MENVKLTVRIKNIHHHSLSYESGEGVESSNLIFGSFSKALVSLYKADTLRRGSAGPCRGLDPKLHGSMWLFVRRADKRVWSPGVWGGDEEVSRGRGKEREAGRSRGWGVKGRRVLEGRR